MAEASRRGSHARWAFVASTIAPVFIAVVLAALVVIPVVLHSRNQRFLEDVSQLAEPSRYLLDSIATSAVVQTRAARSALSFPEQRGQAALLHQEASDARRRALAELTTLTRSIDESAYQCATRLEGILETWSERQSDFLTGKMSADEFRRIEPAQDALFSEASGQWRRCTRILHRFTEERRQESFALDRAKTVITSGLAAAALLTLLVVAWLAHRARSVEQALRGRVLAERSAAARAEVLAQVSHDLRSPLTAIVTSAATLQRAASADDPQLRRPIERIESAARRMNRLVNDLLDHERLAAGKGLGMNAYDVDVLPIVLRCREEASPDRPGRVRYQVDEQARRVVADPDRLEQVLMNLLNNALKFSPPSAPVDIEVSTDGDGTVFRVRDMGPGIAPEEQPHLFEAFWQSPETRRPGYGLGLAIARGIVEAHGGRIWLEESTPERGSTFAFRLPRA